MIQKKLMIKSKFCWKSFRNINKTKKIILINRLFYKHDIPTNNIKLAFLLSKLAKYQ